MLKEYRRIYRLAKSEIHDTTCPNTGKPYAFTKIADLRPRHIDEGEDPWLAKRKAEAQMYFRNITDLDEDSLPICPHCGKAHE